MTNSYYENYKKGVEERKGNTLVPIGFYKRISKTNIN